MQVALTEKAEAVLQALKEDRSVREIWLIGSRANGGLHPTSDSDLLVLADGPPSRNIRWDDEVDVFWLGPDEQLVVVGGLEGYVCAPLHWEILGDGLAEYTGRDSKHHPAGELYDADEPAFRYPRERAIELWHRS